MSAYSSRASYKKKEGILSIPENRTAVAWTPTAPGSNPITIAISRITNLQMTPVTNPKCSIKIFAKPAKEGDSESYVFQFTSANNARGEGEAFVAIINPFLQASRGTATPQPGAKAGEAGASAGARGATPAAPAPAAATGGAAKPKEHEKPEWEDDQRLLKDIEIQKSLLMSNMELQQLFAEAMGMKSQNITTSQFTTQFWTARLPLLRAHAFEKAQQRGTYNVLVTLKPRTEEGATKLNISRDQIKLLFKQHPLVLKAYDECVPKIREEEFWSRFAQSRLFKKLRGERISNSDPSDNILDKYLHVDTMRYQRPSSNLPHIIDLSGNEENHSQRQGNRPDLDMRPTNLDKVPIIRTLNELSGKLLSNVAPSDVDPSAPIGMGEEEFDRRMLALRDLKEDEEVKRYVLKIRDQNTLFSAGNAESQEMVAGSSEAEPKPARDPTRLLKGLRGEMDSNYPEDSANLGALIGQQNDEDDSDEEEAQQTNTKKRKIDQVGTKESMHLASDKILDSLRTRRAQEGSLADTNKTKGDTFGLTKTIYERTTLTHATSNEFLRQFWQAFLSGNPDRAAELSSLNESLIRASDRIASVEKDAEQVRQSEINRIKAHIRETYETTKKRLRINPEKTAPPGASAVKQLLGPTKAALERAIQEYKKALAEAQAQAASGVASSGHTPGSANGRTTPQPSAA
ncbi:RNA polymerase II transcription factor B subunit 1 [Ascosphaera pollenicola]|nr:RNA polymerase II transcription factor B subunit 1 [Ascosphaera pollenicola]